jgi:hypothetical protein
MEKEYLQKYLQINRGKDNIFDSRDVPFIRVAPELSDLGENTYVANEFREKWPAISFNKASLVDGAVLIQDVSADKNLTESIKKLNEFSNITLQIVDGLSLTRDLITLIKKDNILDLNPLIIYPGNGARSVKSFAASIDARFDNGIYLPTGRTMVRKGEFKLSVDYSSLPQRINTKNILIIDDVVASGQTARTIAYGIKNRFQNAKCMIAAWLFLTPIDSQNIDSQSGLENINKTFTSLALKGNAVSRPPINSLSCFIKNGGKYDLIKNGFIQNYINNKERFLTAIDDYKNYENK